METLDRIIQMQGEGNSDNQIMAQLQNEGISPTAVNEALQQAKIKNAVSPPEPQTQEPQAPAPAAAPQEPQVEQPQGMQPSMMPAPDPSQVSAAPMPPQQEYAPQPQEDYYTPQPQAYGEQDIYPQQEGYGTDTMSEIAEQVATEKLEDYKSKVGDVASFKNQTQNKVNDIDDRLKRIENSIDKLQQAILGKIGEFGESSAMIHRDLDNLHGTVSKLMNPLINNVNEMKKANKK